MRTHFHGVAVDVARAESSRFRHPLLLVHGLWTGSAIWRGFMGYLAHRGWDSWAPSFLEGDHVIADRGPFRGRPLPDAARAAGGARSRCGRAPRNRARVRPRSAGGGGDHAAPVATRRPAAAGSSPGRDSGALGSSANRAIAARWCGRCGVSRGGGRVASRFGRVVSRAFAAASVPCADRPSLLIGSTGDRITDAAEAERLARERGWAFHRHDGRGHFPMMEPGWERLADDVHRWLVRTLGEALLSVPRRRGPRMTRNPRRPRFTLWNRLDMSRPVQPTPLSL